MYSPARYEQWLVRGLKAPPTARKVHLPSPAPDDDGSLVTLSPVHVCAPASEKATQRNTGHIPQALIEQIGRLLLGCLCQGKMDDVFHDEWLP
jgi:hypothetical protein